LIARSCPPLGRIMPLQINLRQVKPATVNYKTVEDETEAPLDLFPQFHGKTPFDGTALAKFI
jgi:hypothetical protein